MTGTQPAAAIQRGRVQRWAVVVLWLGGLSIGSHAMGLPIDVQSLWDFDHPERSEQRFRQALATAQGDEALILYTQIARSQGLRQQFVQARALLEGLQPVLAGAGPEVQVRWWLEWGRTWVSAAHAPEQRTAEARARAGMAWERAAQQARAAGLDDLAVDALHMLAFVETEPATQRQRTEVALAVAQASRQPAAQRWQASLYNNLGMAWHEAGRDDLALAPFEQALRLREAQGEAGPTRVARWMVAWCLRLLGRTDEALARQQALAEEGEAAADPDPYVYEELELLYRARGDTAQADAAARRRQALNP